jgi:hypothetical protein
MEERMIDDEYGRGVRLRKTKDGYVDVTDEQVDENDEEIVTAEEISFEFPTFEVGEDEEDLIGLSPEEVEKRRKEKAEKEEKRRVSYLASVEAAQALLDEGDFANAEVGFKKAMKFSDEPTEASVGYWTAKTEGFEKPDVLADEYLDSGVESMEFDVGYRALEIIRETYGEKLQRRLTELEEEEAPLKAEVEEKQSSRRAYIKERLKKSGLVFGISFIPFIVCVVLLAVYGLKNFSTPDNRYIPATIAFGVGTFIFLIAFVLCANKWYNDFRLYRRNEKLESTESGARLSEIVLYKEIYTYILTEKTEETEEADAMVESENE